MYPWTEWVDRLLTETDGPFTQINGRPTEPADIQVATEAIACVRNVPADQIATAVRFNLQTLLR
jgi:TatD DNase family protein